MLDSEFVDTFRRLWRHTNASRKEILAFQRRKLRVLIHHAYRNVPYYRQLFDRNGIKPNDIRSMEDLSAIPITSTKDYRTRPLEHTIAQGTDPTRLISRKTSGSSGKPFTIRRGYWEEHLLNMFRIRAFRQYGIRVADRNARISLTSGINGSEPLRISLPKWLRQSLGAYRTYPINCLQDPETIVAQLFELRPDLISGYPAVIAAIAPVFRNHPSAGNFPRLILTGAESLLPFQRKKIQNAFGAPVFDFYGANECNLVAWECPKTGQYHVCDDNIVLELLRDGRPANIGESGEVVLTCLHSYTMPFIRYSLGDIATRGPETCACGQPFSTIESIQGRLDDYFHLPDGRRFHPYEIDIPAIISRQDTFVGQYRLVQEQADRVRLDIVALRPPTPGEIAYIRKIAEERLGPDVEFCLQIVDRLDFEPSGKFRYRRSFVTSEYDRQ